MKTCRFRPRFDLLETRLALAVAVTQGDFDGNGTQDIRILGDAASQNVVIDDFENSIALSVDANGDGDFADGSDRDQEVINGVFETFIIQLGDGSDNFTFNVPVADYDGAVKSLLVDLGKQADTFLFNASADRDITNSSITIDVVGGGGGDDVSATVTTVVNSALSINFDLQGGSDIGGVFLLGNINGGSVVDAHVDLGAKNNNYTLVAGGNSLPTFDNASVTLDVTGGSGPLDTDTINYTSAGKLTNNASLLVKADLGGGNDTFTGNLNLVELDIDATSQMRFDLNGDEGNDSLQLLASGAFGNADTDVFGLLEVNISGGAGADLITASLGRTSNSSNLELDGTLRARLSGGSENDQVNFHFGSDPTTDGTLDVVMLGNAGDDQLAYTFRDDGNTNFGPAGFALVDGGLGDDRTFANTNGAAFDPASVRLRNAADPTGNTPGVTTGDFDGNGTLDLRILGTDGTQILSLGDNPAAATMDLQLDLNGDGDLNDAGDVDQVLNGPFETVYIQVLGGADLVNYFVHSSFNTAARSVLVDLGKQADRFTQASSGGFDLVNSAYTLDVLAGGGGDTIQAILLVDINDSVCSVDLDLGGGSDTATVFTNRVTNASVLDIQASLGKGNNNFDLSVIDDLHTGGPTVQVDISGGNVRAESDTVNVNFQRSGSPASDIALLNGARLFVDVNLQAGNDRFEARYDLFRIDIDAASASRFRVKGGTGDDNINILRTDTPGDAGADIAGLWSFDLNGGQGIDETTLFFGGDGSVFELDGTFRFRAHGGTETDLVLLDLGTDVASTGKLDALLQGGPANDNLSFTFVDNGNETFPPAGFVILDGGLGTDTVSVTGSGAGFDTAGARERNDEV